MHGNVCPADASPRKGGLETSLDRSHFVYKGEVAITGISGRMPQSANIQEFRDHLMNKEDMVTAGSERWEMGFHGLPARNGKLKELKHFDAAFFGVHAKQADFMDPQLRLLLEVCYEALVDAGQSLESVRGTRTGVFIGVSESECSDAWGSDPNTVVGYGMLGCCRAMFANRVSFFFDLKGPSYALDTACSSSTTCLDHALFNIRAGKIDAALVGGATICIKPQTSQQFHGMGMMAPDGSCKTFDASGDGYCRSEAIPAIYLQKAGDAKRIYATVVHSKANCDGFKEQGITFPSGVLQKQVIEEVYEETGINPADIDYMEAHGTGTRVGDPQEINTIVEVFCRNRNSPLKIGSTKSNMGHAEAASGLTSIVKIIIAMEEGVIPPNLHYKSPNPEIPGLTDGSLQVIADCTEWDGGLVAMSSFGFGGANVHAILRSHDKTDRSPHPASDKLRLFTYGARTEDGVKLVLAEMQKHAKNVEVQALLEASATMPTHQVPYRGYTVLNATSQIQEVSRCGHGERPVWFVFSGMGTQWQGMGRHMMALDVFRESILRSSNVLSSFNLDLYNLIMNGDESSFVPTVNAFSGIAAIQVALVDLLTSMDIRPDGIIGHSVGELGCGYADGSLTAEETVLAAYWRGRCISEAKLPPGKMAAVGLSWEECKRQCPEGVVPACHNSEDTVTISGPFDATTRFVESLKAKAIFAKEVNTSGVAYHSQYMQSIAPQLKAALEKVIQPKMRSPRWVSTSVPESRWGEDLAKWSSASYYVNNLVSAVLFQEGLQKVPSNAIAIEVAPHCLLQAILKRSLSPDATSVGLMKRLNGNNVEFFFSSLGKCYANGMNMKPLGMFQPVEFPVPVGTPMLSSCISKTWDHSQDWNVPTCDEFIPGSGSASSDAVFEIDISPESDDHYLTGHKIDDRVLYPATGYLVLVWKALAQQKGMLYTQMPVVFKDVSFIRATVLPRTGTVTLSVSIMPATGEFQILENNSVVSEGVVYSPDEGPFLDRDRFPEVKAAMSKGPRSEFALTQEEAYKEFRLRGYEYGPTFQGMKECRLSGKKRVQGRDIPFEFVRMDPAKNSDSSVSGQEYRSPVSIVRHAVDTGALTWSGNWVVFMDLILQFNILSGSGFSLNLPCRVKSVKVDPRTQPPPPVEGETQDLPIYFDPVLAMTTCGAVEIKGLHAVVAPRRNLQADPSLDEIFFVPFNRDIPVSKDLAQYASECQGHIMENLKKQLSLMPKKAALQELLENYIHKGTPSHTEVSNQGNSSLAQILSKLTKMPVTKDLRENARTLLQSGSQELATDKLLASLDCDEVLKPCIDIFVDNLFTRNPKVFEVRAGESLLYKKILPLIKVRSHHLDTYTYTAADHNSEDKDAKVFGVKPSQWDPATASAAPPGKVHLLVMKNVLHKLADMDKAFKMFSDMILPGGFLLVEEVTQNLYLQAALDVVADKFDPVTSADDSRVFGRYFTESSLMNVFTQQGFEVVYRRSDSLLSTVFMLRKSSRPKTAPEILSIDDLGCSWLEELQAKVKALETSPEDARLWLTARGDINGLAGFMGCLHLEAGAEKVRSVFINNFNSNSQVPDISPNSEEFKRIIRRDLVNNVYRDGQWGTFTYMPIYPEEHLQTTKPCEFAYVNVQTRGDLASLRWIESPLKYFHQMQTHQADATELCNVYYTSLNFRDIMLATGKLPPDAIPGDMASQDCLLGMEFSGRDSEGRRVMGILPAKGLATVVDTAPRFLWEVPAQWSMEQAATVPVVYSTAYYALVVRGRIRKGDKVLVHSGSGGVGQAAISVALSYGCEVFTTVGSAEKREYLKKIFPQLRDTHISHSRDVSFEFDILNATDGKGVDVVLNSLSDDKLFASVAVLADHGRFLEIGKYDLARNTRLGMSVFLRNINFCGILLDALFEPSSPDWPVVAQLVKEGMTSGVVRPLDTTVFPGHEVELAFRFMAQGKHTGKVLVKVRSEESRSVVKASPVTVQAVPRVACQPAKSYIVVGGLGGFGLELTHWLVDRGARNIVLSSRSGIRTTYQRRKVEFWRRVGARVEVSQHDVKTPEGARALLKDAAKLGPVAGLFNLAMVLQDGLLENQTNEMYQKCCGPKILGTINLDKACRELCADSLDWFVVFSSLISGRGNPGQTNYGFANSVMDRLCERRHRDGLPALSIQWGSIGDVGHVAEIMGGNETVIAGTLPQRMASCLKAFEKLMTAGRTIMSSFVLLQRDTSGQQEGAKVNLLEAVARIMGVKEVGALDPDTSLADMGLDSMMGVEIKQVIERDYDLSLSTKEIRLLTIKTLHDMSSDDGTETQPSQDEQSNDGRSGAGEPTQQES